MLARIADDLSRGIKTHRLRVQERGAEDIGAMAFEPRGGIGDERKRSRVAFRESIAAKAFELREGALGKFLRVAAYRHAAHELVFEGGYPAGKFEGRHGAAKLIGLARGKTRAFDGNSHRLLLEQRHAQGLPSTFSSSGLG